MHTRYNLIIQSTTFSSKESVSKMIVIQLDYDVYSVAYLNMMKGEPLKLHDSHGAEHRANRV